MILSLSLILFGIAAYLHAKNKADLREHFLLRNAEQEETESFEAINIGSLYRAPIYRKIKASFNPALSMLGKGVGIKLVLYFSVITGAALFINTKILFLDNYWLPVLAPVFGFLLGWQWLLNKRRKEFEQSFPDALNIMMSAITAGESITQSICYVGNTIDNRIGREFRSMGEHLKLGEPPEQVFKRACKNIPYPTFLFFIVTIRANMARGGQLKNVMARLIRVLVDARTLEKKKMAMTSEARLSAKIVAMIPIAFMLLLNYINPENVNFVLTDPSGRYILYYVIASESLGLFIVWLLVKGVR